MDLDVRLRLGPTVHSMGIVLRGQHGEFVLNNRGWASLLRLAWDRGWRPEGTSPPPAWDQITSGDPGRRWNPADYVTCKGQRVSAGDAGRLGEALGSILDDLPTHDALSGEGITRVSAPGCPPWLYFSDSRPINNFEALGGPNKDSYVAFIQFCRVGGFAIW